MRLPLPDVDHPILWAAISTLLVGYILYTMIRKRKGERPGFQNREPEL